MRKYSAHLSAHRIRHTHSSTIPPCDKLSNNAPTNSEIRYNRRNVQYPEAEQIQGIINGAQRIVILQADNPDGDSLGSALALEQILHEMGKEPLLYCGVDI